MLCLSDACRLMMPLRFMNKDIDYARYKSIVRSTDEDPSAPAREDGEG